MANCALCGTAAPSPFRAPPAEGSPDLDGRPGEPSRSTLRRWLQCCTKCRAFAPDVSLLPASALGIPESEAYRRLKTPFLRWAALVAGTPAEAEALLEAAWDAEDDGNDAQALRRRSAAVWPAPEDVESALRLADVQRRAGLFAEALRTLDGLPAALADGAAQIAAFERTVVQANDAGRHLMSSALRPPARTPPVTHGKRKASGFWSRLLGGSA